MDLSCTAVWIHIIYHYLYHQWVRVSNSLGPSQDNCFYSFELQTESLFSHGDSQTGQTPVVSFDAASYVSIWALSSLHELWFWCHSANVILLSGKERVQSPTQWLHYHGITVKCIFNECINSEFVYALFIRKEGTSSTLHSKANVKARTETELGSWLCILTNRTNKKPVINNKSSNSSNTNTELKH